MGMGNAQPVADAVAKLFHHVQQDLPCYLYSCLRFDTVYSLEFREQCESFRHEVLAGTGGSNGSQGSTSTTRKCVFFFF